MSRPRRLALMCIIMCCLFPLTASADVALQFGVYTTDKPSQLVKKLRPILNVLEFHMTRHLGEPVRINLQVARNYEQGLRDLVEGSVDFARFGPASYIKAKETNPDIKILAMENHKGGKFFHGIICVHQHSSIQHGGQLQGKRFAFGNARSTFGRYLAQQFLLDHGITASNLAGFDYLGRHDKVGSAVGAGRFDAGALKENTFHRLVAKGVPLRAIAKIPIVTRPWIARSGLPAHLYTALRGSLLNLTDPHALKELKKNGFLPGDDSDYAGIRQAMSHAAAFTESDRHAEK